MNRFIEIAKSFYRKHWKMIVCQIQAVDDVANIKRGFLFDCSSVDLKVLSRFLLKLKEENLISKDISLLEVKEDIFILNKRKFLKESFHVVIDVSGSLTYPKRLEDERDCDKMFIEIRRQIESSDEVISTLEIDERWCVPTIFGYLINYPILYQCDQHNNLSFVELKVFQIRSINQTLISFSVPSELYEKDSKIQEVIKDWLVCFQNKDKFQIETFSAEYPTVIL